MSDDRTHRIVGDAIRMGGRARLLALRPRLTYGGHIFAPADHDNACCPPLWRCVRCHGVVAQWMLTEGWWPAVLAWWCPQLLDALPAGYELDGPDNQPDLEED